MANVTRHTDSQLTWFLYLLQLALIVLWLAEVGDVATWSIWEVMIPLYALLSYYLALVLVIGVSFLYLRRKEPR